MGNCGCETWVEEPGICADPGIVLGSFTDDLNRTVAAPHWGTLTGGETWTTTGSGSGDIGGGVVPGTATLMSIPTTVNNPSDPAYNKGITHRYLPADLEDPPWTYKIRWQASAPFPSQSAIDYSFSGDPDDLAIPGTATTPRGTTPMGQQKYMTLGFGVWNTGDSINGRAGIAVAMDAVGAVWALG